VSTFFEYLEK